MRRRAANKHWRERASRESAQLEKSPAIAGLFHLTGASSSKGSPGSAACYAVTRLEAGADRTGGIAARSAIGAEADPRPRAGVGGPYDGGCAVRRLLTRHIDIHCLIVSQDVLRHDLLLRAIGPLLRDACSDGLRRLLALAHGLDACRWLGGGCRNCHGQSD